MLYIVKFKAFTFPFMDRFLEKTEILNMIIFLFLNCRWMINM